MSIVDTIARGVAAHGGVGQSQRARVVNAAAEAWIERLASSVAAYGAFVVFQQQCLPGSDCSLGKTRIPMENFKQHR